MATYPWPLVSGATLTAANMNAIGAWTAFTPSWTGVTSTGASNSGQYCLLNDTLFFRAQYVVGTSPTIGAIKLTVPFSQVIAGSPTPNLLPSVQCNFIKLLSQPYVGQVLYSTSTLIELRAVNTAGTYGQTTTTTSAIPFTWAQFDTIEVSGFVQVD